MKETHKPHIERLPVTAFPAYPITDKELAVTIPLFHSDIDSATLKPSTIDRLTSIHAKGAIWAALGLINNTDLAEKGVGIYFHIEDKLEDALLPVFESFGVPEAHLRPMRLDMPAVNPNIQSPIYGKKFMCVEDRLINVARWLIMDSDAFVCSAEQKLHWYDKLKVFQNPSAIKSRKVAYEKANYRTWVHGVCLAAGVPFKADEDLRSQEKRAFYTLGHWKGSYRLPALEADPIRTYLCTQMFLLPMQHALVDHIREHYKTCYQDEFLLGLWNLVHDDISDLRDKLGFDRMYDFETQYLERDRSLDALGYLAHIVPDHHGESQKRVNEYYDDFYEHLSTQKRALGKPKRSSVSEHLKETRSDKEHPNGHRYGAFYDMLFESMAFRQGRKLRVLEIGVSMFGHGSLDAFQRSEIVERAVGIDIISYHGELGENCYFHKADGYKDSTVDHLKREYPDGFDIIIDDGTHLPEHQLFFLENYGELLTEGGKLVCEDVGDPEFFEKMCKEYSCHGIDGWANTSYRPDWERILVRDKADIPVKLEPPSSDPAITAYTPPAKKRFFVLDVPYAHKGFMACAFVQRVEKWCAMMSDLGHEIIYIGHTDRKIACTEHIGVIDDDILTETYGAADYIAVPEHAGEDYAFQTFKVRAEEVLREHAREDDFVLAFYGYGHRELCENIADLPVIVVEPSIGYPDAFSENRVYQSSAKMHFERGRADTGAFIQAHLPNDEYNELLISQYNRKQYTVPDRNACVIPNFFDFDHFNPQDQKEDVMCFVGRINICKGLHDVFRLAAYTDTPLLLAGVGRLEQCGLDIPKQVEFLGVADMETRSDTYARARVHVCPSIYLEPFLGAGVESLFCKTPHLTSNWGAPMDWCIHGKTGYRVQNFDQLVWGFEHIDRINGDDCYHQALQYSKERAAISYHEYFNILLQNKNGGRWSVNPERTNLDWLNADMSKPEIDAAVAEIKAQIARE